MAMYIDLEEKDPLDLVIKNKNFVKHLRGNGIDGFKINKILRDKHGLKREWPISMTRREIAERRQIEYAMRHANALISNAATTDEEKEYLCKMYNRLWHKFPSWEKGKSGGPVYKMVMGEGEGDAKTLKQMIGQRVVSLHRYIKPFNKMFLQKDIFSLIAELFEVVQQHKLTQQQIKNFDKNNW